MDYFAGAPGEAAAEVRLAPQLLSYRNVGIVTALSDASLIIAASLISGVGYHLLALGYAGDVGAFFGIGVNAAVLFVLLAQSQGMYRASTIISARQARGVVAVWVAILVAVVALLFLLKLSDSYSRGSMVGLGAIGLGLLLTSRALIAKNLRDAVARGSVPGQRAVVVGEKQELDHFVTAALRRRYGINEVGRFELPHAASEDQGSPPAGCQSVLEMAINTARANQAEIILLALRWADKARYHDVREYLRVLPLPVLLLPDQSVRSILAEPMVEIGADFAVELQRAPLTRVELALKRSLDVFVAGSLLVVLSPLLALVSFAIRMNSSGPVIFRQKRKGFNGQQFTIYKFRSMNVCENGDTIRQAQRQDERVTRLGSFLRSSSIDELPQLVNVLRGEMSLVGPRPHAVAHDDEYSRLIGNYAFRHHVKPGITGWAQVNGLRGGTAKLEQMEGRVERDLWYINNWSIWLDIWILLLTCVRIRDPNAY